MIEPHGSPDTDDRMAIVAVGTGPAGGDQPPRVRPWLGNGAREGRGILEPAEAGTTRTPREPAEAIEPVGDGPRFHLVVLGTGPVGKTSMIGACWADRPERPGPRSEPRGTAGRILM